VVVAGVAAAIAAELIVAARIGERRIADIEAEFIAAERLSGVEPLTMAADTEANAVMLPIHLAAEADITAAEFIAVVPLFAAVPWFVEAPIEVAIAEAHMSPTTVEADAGVRPSLEYENEREHRIQFRMNMWRGERAATDFVVAEIFVTHLQPHSDTSHVELVAEIDLPAVAFISGAGDIVFGRQKVNAVRVKTVLKHVAAAGADIRTVFVG
jgi:hypothetical protein